MECKEINFERLKKKYFILLGNTGSGKSNFVQKITNDARAQVSSSKDSCT